MVSELERETSNGIPTDARVLWISPLLNGTWRTRDLAGELDEGFDETEVAHYVEQRLKASRAEYDAESMRGVDAPNRCGGRSKAARAQPT
jgi:hypothetical protein